jgi:hypothetical protein
VKLEPRLTPFEPGVSALPAEESGLSRGERGAVRLELPSALIVLPKLLTPGPVADSGKLKKLEPKLVVLSIFRAAHVVEFKSPIRGDGKPDLGEAKATPDRGEGK